MSEIKLCDCIKCDCIKCECINCYCGTLTTSGDCSINNSIKIITIPAVAVATGDCNMIYSQSDDIDDDLYTAFLHSLNHECPDFVNEHVEEDLVEDLEEDLVEDIKEPIEDIKEPIVEDIKEPVVEDIKEHVEDIKEPIEEPVVDIKEHIVEPVDIKEPVVEDIKEPVEDIKEPIEEPVVDITEHVKEPVVEPAKIVVEQIRKGDMLEIESLKDIVMKNQNEIKDLQTRLDIFIQRLMVLEIGK